MDPRKDVELEEGKVTSVQGTMFQNRGMISSDDIV